MNQKKIAGRSLIVIYLDSDGGGKVVITAYWKGVFTLKIKKDSKHDVAYVSLRKGKVASTVELRPGLLFDLDKNGEILGIEVLSIAKLAPILARHKKGA